jgi:hypothetical protein
MGHCRALAWVLTAVVVALPLAGCADSGGIGAPTAPSALSAPAASTGGFTALLENAPFNGHDSGTFELLQTGCTAGLTPLRTHTTGTATLIGAYSFETQECFNTTTLRFSGSFTITAANGDTLSGAYAGNITGFLDDVTAVNVFTATVTGGTGRFAGATGTLSGTGQANLATFQESRTFSGTISVPRSHS